MGKVRRTSWVIVHVNVRWDRKEDKIREEKRKNRTQPGVRNRQKIILGLPWLIEHNPKIDWKTGKIK